VLHRLVDAGRRVVLIAHRLAVIASDGVRSSVRGSETARIYALPYGTIDLPRIGRSAVLCKGRGDRREAIDEDDDDGEACIGDAAFVERSLRHARQSDEVNIAKAQRRPTPPSLEAIATEDGDREAANVAAHASGGYNDQKIAEYFSVHFTSVGRIVRAAKARDR
jgi:hypothetical protein